MHRIVNWFKTPVNNPRAEEDTDSEGSDGVVVEDVTDNNQVVAQVGNDEVEEVIINQVGGLGPIQNPEGIDRVLPAPSILDLHRLQTTNQAPILVQPNGVAVATNQEGAIMIASPNGKILTYKEKPEDIDFSHEITPQYKRLPAITIDHSCVPEVSGKKDWSAYAKMDGLLAVPMGCRINFAVKAERKKVGKRVVYDLGKNNNETLVNFTKAKLLVEKLEKEATETNTQFKTQAKVKKDEIKKKVIKKAEKKAKELISGIADDLVSAGGTSSEEDVKDEAVDVGLKRETDESDEVPPKKRAKKTK